MRFLLDANLSPLIALHLSDLGFSAHHVRDIGLLAANDRVIFDRAAADGDVVITADADFTALLAARQSPTPSVVLLRHTADLRREQLADLIAANLPTVLEDLAEGAIVSLSPTRLAVRRLPIQK